MIAVTFTYLTGQKPRLFRNARLAGSWNNWSELPMGEIVAEDGCPAFTATVNFNDADAGKTHRWGVRADGPPGANAWIINMEVHDKDSQERYREVKLPAAGGMQDEHYYFTYSRRLGAQKIFPSPAADPDLRFSVWAPNAKSVEVVFANVNHGYISNSGAGVDPTKPAMSLQKGSNGIWQSDSIHDFSQFVGLPYMFKIKNAQGNTVYRTDIHSRWQIGRGDVNPAKSSSWNGDPKTLDGTVSCSVVIDQDIVRKEFEPTTSPPEQIGDDSFWLDEFTAGRPVPTRIEDLVIYELHIGALGFGSTGTGTLADAMDLLDYLSDLGVNAVELLPMSEFSGDLGWGYGDTHHFVIESSAGGRDKYKHFVRECHRRGIAVIQDVVYNHFDGESERAEWQYDSTRPDQNIYYWYEGDSGNDSNNHKGFLNNGSTGYTPRFWEEPVRQLFISSAAEFVSEFHVDGLRVDLTQAIHRDNTLNDPNNRIGIASANMFGQKFLREWSRTLRLIRPTAMLIAEDHTEWDKVTMMPNVGGLGFDSAWFVEFYHHLIGDSDMGGGDASKLIKEAGFGHDGPLQIEGFANRLYRTQFNKVAYHESHDEAGNAGGSLRTCRVAVNDAPLFGSTRDFAEARCRVAAGLTLLSAGTPMFFMGEEIVAQKIYKYDNTHQAKEDLKGERSGSGAKIFRYYQDLIRLRLANRAARSKHVDVIHAYGPTRVIAFTRNHGNDHLLIVASLNNHAFLDGYIIQTDAGRLFSGWWKETFNSDAGIYGGSNVGNYGASIPSNHGRIELRIPANGLLVLQKQ